MNDSQIHSWIFLSISFCDSPATRKQIAEVADGINHAIPTHLEMETSLNWLLTRSLIIQGTDNRFTLTKEGSELRERTARATILDSWREITQEFANRDDLQERSGTLVVESTSPDEAQNLCKEWVKAHPEVNAEDIVLDVLRTDSGNLYRYRLMPKSP
jgi:hypothetical protein